MKQLLSSVTLVAALWGLASFAGQAQPGTGGPSPDSPTVVPLDGGASLLLAGGVAYGLKRLCGRKAR